MAGVVAGVVAAKSGENGTMESGTGRVNIVLSWNWFTHIIMVIFILYEITHCMASMCDPHA